MRSYSLIPFDRYLSHVYVGSRMIGSVEKNVGNWVARDLDECKLTDCEREFTYFATRKAAVAALLATLQ